ncbi:hypothetical protein KCU84_g62, partial [Aureobasidium melanogenum]
MLRKDDVYSGLGEAIRPYSETSKLSYSEYWPSKLKSSGRTTPARHIPQKRAMHRCSGNTPVNSLTDEATESGPPVGGAAGIRGSLSRDLSVFNFIFPSAGFAFLTLTILLTPAKHRRASPKQCSASFPDDGASEASFVTFRCVLTSGAAVAGREAAATLARIVVRFLPLVGACKTSEAIWCVKEQWRNLSGVKGRDRKSRPGRDFSKISNIDGPVFDEH